MDLAAEGNDGAQPKKYRSRIAHGQRSGEQSLDGQSCQRPNPNGLVRLPQRALLLRPIPFCRLRILARCDVRSELRHWASTNDMQQLAYGQIWLTFLPQDSSRKLAGWLLVADNELASYQNCRNALAKAVWIKGVGFVANPLFVEYDEIRVTAAL